VSGPTDWQERSHELDEASPDDTAFSIALAAMQALPLGGVIAQILSDAVPRRREQRVVAFLQDLAREWQQRREQIDHDFVRSDEFDRLAEDVIDRVQTVRQETKHREFAALLAGFATMIRPDDRMRGRMLEALEATTPRQMELLRVIATTNEPPPDLYMGSGMATLKWKLPDWPEDELRDEWSELQRHGLVSGFPGAIMTASGAGNLQGHMTPLGRQFVVFIRTTE